MDAYKTIPATTLGGLRWYITHGVPPGDFLRAVLCNDLRGAVAHADDGNVQALAAIVRWVHNWAPSGCWGSPGHYEAWLAEGGTTALGWEWSEGERP